MAKICFMNTQNPAAFQGQNQTALKSSSVGLNDLLPKAIALQTVTLHL
jgi:hypothetical protein